MIKKYTLTEVKPFGKGKNQYKYTSNIKKTARAPCLDNEDSSTEI